MVGPRILRPASRVLPSILPSAAPRTFLARPSSVFTSRTIIPVIPSRRSYATPSGVKEIAVRDALNEALAEELELDDKVFVLGEEVAQYNGAYVHKLNLHTAHLLWEKMSKLRLYQAVADVNSSIVIRLPRVCWTASAKRGLSTARSPSLVSVV